MRLSKDRGARILLVCATWIVLALLLGLAGRGDWQTTWHRVGVTANPFAFGDVLAIPQALEKQRHHIDAYVQTPDTIDFNYPRIWLRLFSALHLERNVVGFELAMIALYLGCMSHLMLVARERLAAVLVMVGTLSSVSLLAVERGNTDLLMFSLVYLSAQTEIALVAGLLLMLAGALKLYPTVALLPRGWTMPRHVRLFIIAIWVMVAYQWMIRTDLLHMVQNTPHSMKQSYGVVAISLTVQRVFHLQVRLALIAFAIVCGALLCWRGASSTPSNSVPLTLTKRYEALLCMMFVTIFLATFVATPNYEYRMIFLIPALPYCVGLRRTGKWPRLSLAALVLTMIAMEPRLAHDFMPLRVLAAGAQECCFPVYAFVLGLASQEFPRPAYWPFRTAVPAARAVRDVKPFPIQS